MASQHYCLRWNNYQTNMTSVFHQLLQNEAFVDVTLACNDLSLKAHKVVLSACSSYFQKLLLENPCKHPTIIMPQDVCYEDLKFIIEFVYKGEIDVSQDELQSLLRTADQLKIKGLCEVKEPDGEDGEVLEDYEGSLSSNCPAALALPFLASHHRRKFPKIARRLSFTSRTPSGGSSGSSGAPQDCEQKPSTTNNNDKHLVDLEGGAGSRRFSQNNKKPCVKLRDSPAKGQETEGALKKEEEGAGDHGTVGHSSEEDNDMPVAAGKGAGSRKRSGATMSTHGLIAGALFPQLCGDEFPPEPPAPSATPVEHIDIQDCSPTRTLLTNTSSHRTDLTDAIAGKGRIKLKFETLRSIDQGETLDIDAHMQRHGDHSMGSQEDDDHSMHSMMITPEFLGMGPGSSGNLDMNDMGGSLRTNGHSNDHRSHSVGGGGPKTWTQEDMELALDALRNHNMSLTKASATYGIPSTTLWQRAHRLGIDTPKKEGPTKSWTEENLNSALDALRTGTISANKASKAYGIPSSTLYKIARREGIRLAAPFNAAPTTWSPEDLERALESIRSGQTSVQRASTEYGIPTGTLYGRCKREGIELSRSNPTPWSEDAMGEALEAVRIGQMSINQAAIHYNLPYSSLYGRFKRGKYETEQSDEHHGDSQVLSHQYHHNQHSLQYQHQTNS